MLSYILVVVALNLLHQCLASWPSQGPELCVIPSTTQIRPHSTCSDTTASTSACAAAHATVQAQIGEVEDIQLLLRKSTDSDDIIGGLKSVTINVSGFPNFVTVTMYRVGYVFTTHSPRYPGSGGGWRPDPLLPIGGHSFDVPPNIAQPIYVSLAVNRNATPGDWNGTILLSCTLSDDTTPCGKKTVPVNLHIFNVTLPTLRNTRLGSAWSGNWAPQTFAPYYPDLNFSTIKYKWFDMMMESRMPPDSIYLTKARDYSDYVYMGKHGVQWFAILDVSALPLTLSSSSSSTPNNVQHVHSGNSVGGSCANYTSEYVQRMIDTLRPIVNKLIADNLLDSAYVYGFDENPISCEPQVRQLFGAVKESFPTLKTAAVLNWSPMPIDLPVDIWILQYQKFNATDVHSWTAAGKKQWLYHCIEPHDLSSLNTFIERPGLQNRLLMWYGALNQLKYNGPSGWLYYAVNLWRPCDNPLCARNISKTPLIQNFTTPMTNFPVANYIWQGQYNDIFVNGDGQYLYPCEKGLPCGSIRLSNLRDGLEDWDGLFSIVDSKIGVPLIEEMVRGARDWGFTGEERMEQIRKIVADSL